MEEEEKEQVPKRESDLWGRGVLAGLAECAVLGTALVFFNDLAPLKDQFSSDEIKFGIIALVCLGFLLADHDGKPAEIRFAERWGYCFGGTLAGFGVMCFSYYVGFFCISFAASMTFGAWLKMVWLKSKLPRRLRKVLRYFVGELFNLPS